MKRLLTLLLSFCVFFSLFSSGAYALENESPKSLVDTQDFVDAVKPYYVYHEAYKYNPTLTVENVRKKGIKFYEETDERVVFRLRETYREVQMDMTAYEYIGGYAFVAQGYYFFDNRTTCGYFVYKDKKAYPLSDAVEQGIVDVEEMAKVVPNAGKTDKTSEPQESTAPVAEATEPTELKGAAELPEFFADGTRMYPEVCGKTRIYYARYIPKENGTLRIWSGGKTYTFRRIYDENFDLLSDNQDMKYNEHSKIDDEYIINDEGFGRLSYEVEAGKTYVIAVGTNNPAPEKVCLWMNLDTAASATEPVTTEPGTEPTETKPTEPAKTQPTVKTAKKNQPLKVSAVTKTVKASKLKKAKVTVKKSITVKNNKGAVTYSKVSGSKYLKISSKGVITIKKGKYKKGTTLKLKVKVTAKGNSDYKKCSGNVTVKIKVK